MALCVQTLLGFFGNKRYVFKV